MKGHIYLDKPATESADLPNAASTLIFHIFINFIDDTELLWR